MQYANRPSTPALRGNDAPVQATIPRSRPATLTDWLVSSDVVSANGAVRSWWDPAGSGYDYPEVAGMWLSWACRRGRVSAEKRSSVAAWLADLVDASGAVGRGGRMYLFDSAIALSGLIAHEENALDGAMRPAIDTLGAFVRAATERRQAVVPAETYAEPRWSEEYGPHQAKNALALVRLADFTSDDGLRRLARDLAHEQLRHFDGERFATTRGDDQTYLHAGLYALEGLAFCEARGLGDFRAVLEPALDSLARVQSNCGGLHAHAAAAGVAGPLRADATAQAIRLWLIVDPERWAEPVERACRFLESLRDPRGGIVYEWDSNHVNTWSTIFATQAFAWRSAGADAATLI